MTKFKTGGILDAWPLFPIRHLLNLEASQVIKKLKSELSYRFVMLRKQGLFQEGGPKTKQTKASMWRLTDLVDF